jgi:hypothetical protein
MAEALYLPDGDRFVPTVATTGPWDRNAQHGGPSSALLARALERVPSDHPVHVTRLTYDLLRPVPMTPLEIRTEVVRQSRRISVVEAGLFADDVLVMRAAALRIRAGDLELPDDVAPDDVMGSEPGTGEEAILLGGGNAYNDIGVEIRFVEGGFQHRGPGVAWVRLRVPVVAGEEPTPLQRAAAAADLSVHIARPPVGEWIGMRSVTYAFGSGTGMAESAMYDATGRFARGAQSLLIDKQR